MGSEVVVEPGARAVGANGIELEFRELRGAPLTCIQKSFSYQLGAPQGSKPCTHEA